MTKTHSILFVSVTLTLIIAVNYTFTQKNLSAAIGEKGFNYPIVDTGQVSCYDNSREIHCPQPNQPFFGQDAQYKGKAPSYRDSGDGTITDLNTGLMWSQAVDNNKVSLTEANKIAQKMTLGGYTDWRVPNLKELYSLIDFRGYTGFSRGGHGSGVPANAIPFINTDYFAFEYGDLNAGERYIDAQWLSRTKYVSTTMGGMETLFGVNFADGRIKGYGYKRPGAHRDRKKFYVRYVRGDAYGVNNFVDNGDGTVTDRATGLMWMQNDSGKAMNWQDAMEYAQNLRQAGYDDWRLPNAKELQYIVDYSRSPETNGSPALDPIFQTTSIINEAGQEDYPYFWSSTTHLDGPNPGKNAVYIAFGRALGKMHGKIMDVHGAGAQRSDPKAGEPTSRGPQGDMIRINNYVRCVRGGPLKIIFSRPSTDKSKYPYNVKKYQGVSRKEPSDSSGRSRPPSGGKSFVNRLDRNGDGKISRSEFDGPIDRFDFHDINKDGYLTEDEAPKGPPPGGTRPPRQ